jgi:uncharacterized protein (TIGR02145 family)
MKQFYLLVSFILVFNSNHLLAQNDSIYFWKGGIKINQLSIKTADLDSITFKRPSPTFAPLPSVTIGTQVWTTKNLDVAAYSDGILIPEHTGTNAEWLALTTGAWCYYKNNPANGAIYGKLYNWYAVAGIHDNDPNTPNKKLAPSGYHIPSAAEWTTLITYLGGEGVAGRNMKAGSESGFTALPGGSRQYDGEFYNIGTFSSWWSSSLFSEQYTTYAFFCYMNILDGSAGRSSNGISDGCSVRCLRD